MNSSKRSLRAAARPVALSLTVGVLLVGVSACGSSSSTASPPTTPSPNTSAPTGATGVNKEAGAFGKDVQLELVNGRSDWGAINVELCREAWDVTHAARADCPVSTSLAPGKSVSLSASVISGSIHWEIARYGGGDVTFKAANPDVGEPYFDVWGTVDNKSFSLVEGEVQTTSVDGMDVQLERRGDTDVKVMRLIAR